MPCHRSVHLALALLCALLPAAVPADGVPALHDVTDVAAGDVLNVREAPDAGAAIVGTLAPDARGIEVVEEQEGWGRITVDAERSGWASLRFLSPRTGAAFPEHAHMRCFGTEPFWSVRLSQGETAAFSALGQAAPEERRFSVGTVLSGYGPAGPFVVLGDGTAGRLTVALERRVCSDGMSDALYGLGATVVIGAQDALEVWSGCCSLDDR